MRVLRLRRSFGAEGSTPDPASLTLPPGQLRLAAHVCLAAGCFDGAVADAPYPGEVAWRLRCGGATLLAQRDTRVFFCVSEAGLCSPGTAPPPSSPPAPAPPSLVRFISLIHPRIKKGK